MTSLVNGTASFELSLSHDNIPVKWMFKNQELKPSANIQIMSERKAHKLVIQNVDESTDGEYTAVVGHLQCSAYLHVECKYQFKDVPNQNLSIVLNTLLTPYNDYFSFESHKAPEEH